MSFTDKLRSVHTVWIFGFVVLLFSCVTLGVMYYEYEHFEEACNKLNGIYVQSPDEKVCLKKELINTDVNT